MSGAVVWFTGLPASGKTTLAQAVVDRLRGRGTACCLLDSDEFRRRVLPDLKYGAADRDRFYRALAAAAALLAAQGLTVSVAATAPLERHREHARSIAPRYFEVYVATPLERCIERDPKGLYRRAQAGELADVPGVGAPYEAPRAPDYVAVGAAHDAADIVRRLTPNAA